MKTKLLLIHALTPLHAGTGLGVGVIDLPIAREKATQIPFLPGSTLKGVFRDASGDDDTSIRVFGPKTQAADEHAGAVSFTDARLLLLPVRSLRGVFAWVTSPLLLQRFLRDVKNIEGFSSPPRVPGTIPDDSCLVEPNGSELSLTIDGNTKIILEDLPLSCQPADEVSDWAEYLGKMLFSQEQYWKDALRVRLCLVSDNMLSFLLETATEVTARIRLQDTQKTVARGALWYEEALPAETVLASLVVDAIVKAKAGEVFQTIEKISLKPLQFGGNATIGRGLCNTTLI